jgi:ubiquinone/menaquinone biosynthesis C-methylase UbiE
MTKHIEATNPKDGSYILGHDDAEVQRLLLQGRVFHDHTEHALRIAGLRPGMRVLDVGCGPGDVAIAASQLVGPTGTVIAVDVADVIELARARAAELAACEMRFRQCAIEDIALDESVDAVIGRFILMHLPEPVSALRHLAGQLRPGGVFAFAETDISLACTVPVLPLWSAVKSAISDTFSGMGVDPAFGRGLHALFTRAGLKPRLTLAGALGGSDESELLSLVTGAWRSMYPMAQRLGTAPDELLDLETLPARLRKELADNDAIVVMPPMITAWARV